MRYCVIMNSKSLIRKRCAIFNDRKAILQIQISFPPKDKKRQNKFGICSKIDVLCSTDGSKYCDLCLPQYWTILKNLFLSKFNGTPNDGVIRYQAFGCWYILIYNWLLREQRFSVKLRCYSLTEWKNINLIYSNFDSQILE